MHRFLRTPAIILATLILAATAGAEVPAADSYCLTAQKVIVSTDIDVELVVHDDFDAFVKSKAIMNGPLEKPQIQQFNWYSEDGDLLGISCKLKNAEHLNLVYGDGSAGPDNSCQTLNRQVLGTLSAELGLDAYATYKAIVFDPNETPATTEGAPGMSGPAWLAPFTMVREQEFNGNKELVIATKGFEVQFSDPRFQKAPERFRGVRYCHFIAPEHLKSLMLGQAEPPTVIGRDPLADGKYRNSALQND